MLDVGFQKGPCQAKNRERLLSCMCLLEQEWKGFRKYPHGKDGDFGEPHNDRQVDVEENMS